jgi:dihydrofolate synthase/folylpolyglutamate synthase
VDGGLTQYRTALDALFARTGTTSKFGLERSRRYLAQLGNPHEKLKTFHVAGTNGKGSVVATLYALLQAKGLSVGRYMSPHLVDFRERIVVDDEPIGEEYVVRFLERYGKMAEDLGATFFEITSALAFQYFAMRGVDVAIIETGLGGRLDSTNVITPIAAGITSISLDHQEYLGDSEASIAREKAGIFKRNVPGVIGPLSDAARVAVYEVAAANKVSTIIEATRLYPVAGVHLSESGTYFTIRWGRQRCNVHTGLIGEAQAANVSVALSMLRAAGYEWSVTLEDAEKVLPSIKLAGRFQRVGNLILDVAHNVDGIASLAATIRAAGIKTPINATVGILGDKDWKGMLRALEPVVGRVTIVDPPSAPSSRAWDGKVAASFARSYGMDAVYEGDFERAVNDARAESDPVLITGSFHTVGDALQILGEKSIVIRK